MMRKISFSAIFWWTLTAAIMVLIFFFSSQNGEESGKLSEGFLYTVLNFIIPNFEEFISSLSDELFSLFHLLVRKMAHFSVYAALGLSSFMAFRSVLRELRIYPIMLRAFGLSVFYAATDELHQLMVSDRAGRLLDVLIDSSGAAFGILFVALIIYIINKIKTRRGAMYAEQ